LFFLLTAVVAVAQTTTTYPTQDLPYNVLLADVDGDGDLDVATFGTGTEFVSIRLNNGEGTYGSATDYSVGTSLQVKAGAFGDINGDGHVDLVMLNNSFTDYVVPFINNGDGTFTLGTKFTATASFYPDFVELADLDGDNDLDLLLSSQFTYLSAGNYVAGRMLGGGDGTFSSLALWAVGTQPVSIATGDVDGDGDLDIAVANMNSDNITLIFNNGSGGNAWTDIIDLDVDSPRRIAFADLDGNGDIDMYVANHDDSNVLRFNNSGSTDPSLVYNGFPTVINTGVNTYPQHIAFDDFNGDGDTDLIVSGADVYTFLGDGLGGLGSVNNVGLGFGPAGFAVGDILGLGGADFAATNLSTDELTIYINAVVPTVTTTAASSITTTGATLNGSMNARGSAADASFAYKLSSAGTYENTIEATPAEVTGTSDTAISADLTGLLPNTSYDFKAVGSNAAGEVEGTVLSFTTADAAPIVTTDAASDISVTTATLNGTVNAQNSDATAYFEYGTTTGVYTTQVNVSGTINDGMDAADVSVGLTGLAANTTYYFRLVATNDGGTTNGDEGTFSTIAPIMLVESVSPASGAFNVTASSDIEIEFNEAVLADSVNARTFIVTGSFSGPIDGAYSSNLTTATFNPTNDFLPGEVISVTLTTDILSDAYDEPLDAPYSFSFTAATAVLDPIAYSLANYATGSGPHEIATGDLNNDGFLDLVSVNQAANTLSVNLSNGDGTFAAAATLATNSFPQGIRLGDMDGDGDLDIVLTHISGGAGIVQYLNNGSGSFGSLSAILLNDGQDIELIDWDSDGDLDILGSTNITLIANNGDATYTTVSNYGSGGTGYFLTKADVNNDGRMDLIASDYGSNVVRIYRNDVNGHFYALASLSAGTNPVGVKAADFNGDGNIDIVVANYTSESIGVYLGNGDGTFGTATTYNVAGGPYDLDVADIDGDGDVDVAVSMQVGDGVNVYLNNGTGTLESPVFFAGGNNPRGIVLADFNGDRKIDIATANNFGNNVSVLKTSIPAPTVTSVSPALNAVDVAADSDITVTFSTPMNASTLVADSILVTGSLGGIYSGSVSSTTNSITFAPSVDFKPGEVVEITVTNSVRNVESVAMARPYTYMFTVGSVESDGLFRAGASIDLDWNDIVTSEQIDIDGDGDIDIVSFTTSGYVLVRKNDGNGGYAATSQAYIGSGTLDDALLFDIDQDGDLDVVSAHYDLGRIGILRNNGSGAFSDPKSNTASGASALALVDMNADGFADVIMTNRDLDRIDVYLHNGYTNQFIGFGSSSANLATGISPRAIVSGDLNGDGNMDVAVADSGSANISVFLNNANGTLATAVSYTVGTVPSKLTMADIDGDGHLDILVANTGSDNVSVLVNNGDGTFENAVNYTVGDEPSAITATDIDGDGLIDLLVANAASDNVSILLNEGSGTFAAADTYAAGDNPIGIHALDMDGDGDLDLYTTNADSHNITILKRTSGPNVAAVTPAANSLNVAATANITVEFDEAMDAATITSSTIIVSGSFRGIYDGGVSYVGNTATFNPTDVFLPGERITVTVTTGVENASNEMMEYTYSWTFDTESAAGSVSFIRADISSVSGVEGVVATDIDGDGDLDLVVTQNGNDYVSVLINDGSGSFASPANYDTGSGPYTVKVSDLDNDGLLDLSVTNDSDGTISILLNDGVGGFDTAVNYSLQSGPRDHHHADLNGDGYLDIVVYNVWSGSFSVLMNDGDGTFAAAVHYTDYPSWQNTRMELADMDGDGALDVVILSSYTDYGDYDTDVVDIQIVKNIGQGVFFGGTEQIITDLEVSNFSLADLNGDGRLDISMTDQGGNQVLVFLRNLDGTYPTTASASFSVASGPIALVASDLDGDGDLDLAVSGSGGQLSFALNAGDATFGTATNVSTNHNVNTLIAADISGEGQLDLIVGHSSGLNILGPMPAPTTSASNVTFDSDYGTQVNVDWNNGNGAGRIVIMKQGSEVDFVPVANTNYSANASFGDGTELGTGNYVVFNSTQSWQSSVYVSNLTMGTEYHVKVYEYNQDGGVIKFKTTDPASGSTTTASSPDEQGYFGEFNSDYGQQISVDFGSGSGLYRIVVMKEGGAVDATPSDNTTYLADTNFGDGSEIGTGNFVIFNGSGSGPVTVTGIQAGTTYHVAVFDYNGGNGSEVFNTTIASGNIGSTTTNAVAGFPFDTTAGHAVTFTGVEGEDEYPYAEMSGNIEFGDQFGDQFSVEMWVKPGSIGTDMSFFSVTGYLYLMDLGLNVAGQFTATVADTTSLSNVTVTGTQTATANTWYHVAMTAESNGLVKLFVNGTQDGSASIGELLMEGESGRPYIGAMGEIDGESYVDATDFFVGDIDELRIWTRIRTESEIRAERRTTVAGFPDQLVGYWQFNDTDEEDRSYDQFLNQSSFRYVTFVESTAPFGGTSDVATAVQAGPVSLGNVDLTLTDAFDNPVDVQVTEITGDPNQFPEGYNSSLGGKVFLIELFGDPGMFSASVTLNYGTEAITPEQEADPSQLKLFKRESNSTGTWTDLGGAYTAVASTGDVTWTGITSFSQFVVVSDDNLTPPVTIWSLEDGYIVFNKPNGADWTLEANQDRITDNVWITRKNNQGLFNIAAETGYTGSYDDSPSPQGTLWAYGTAADYENLTFDTWSNTHGGVPPEMVGEDMVMYLADDNLYIDVRFTSWTQSSNGGGFTYARGSGVPNEPIAFADTAGSALAFDGVDDYMILNRPSSISEFPANATFEMWVKPGAIPMSGTAVFASGEQDNHQIGIDATGAFFAKFYDEDYQTVTGTTIAEVGKWYHIAASIGSSGELNLYVNGDLEGTTAFGEPYSSIDYFAYGRADYDENSYFQGELDEIRIWTVERTATQIRANVFNGKPDATIFNTLAIWQLNEGSGTTAEDLVNGNNLDLSLTATPPSWVTSNAPLGGSAGVASGVQSGSAEVGGATLTFNTPFENPVDVFFNEITTEPNVFPTGFTSSIGGKYFVIDLVGTPGTFSLDLTLTFGEGVVTEANEASPSMLKLYRRASGSGDEWTELSGATSAVAATGEVTWAGITAFSEFIVTESEPTDIFGIASLDVTTFYENTYTFDSGLFDIDAFFGDSTFTITLIDDVDGALFVDLNDNGVADEGIDRIVTTSPGVEYTPSVLEDLRFLADGYGPLSASIIFTSGEVADTIAVTFTTVETTPTISGEADEAGWYLLSNPLDTPLGTLFSNIWTQGAINSDAPSADATLYTFSSETSGYSAVTTDLDTTKVSAGQGVLAYIFAFDDLNAGVPEGGGWPKTLTNEGNPFTAGTATVQVTNVDTYMPEGTSGSEGFNLFGNPYAWPMSADSLIATLKRADPLANSYVYRWNQPYQTWQLVTSGAIQPYEAVFIRAITSGTDAELEFTYDDRYVAAPPKEVANPLFALTLTHPESGLESVSNLRFDENAAEGIDPYDGYYLGSYSRTYANLFAQVEGQSLVINNLPTGLDREIVVPMHLHASVNGEFELSWDQSSLPTGWTFSIEDAATGTVTDLVETGSLRFNSERLAKADANRNGVYTLQSNDEPVLILRARGPGYTTDIDDRASLPTEVELNQNYPNPFNPSTQIRYGVPSQSTVKLEVFDVLGRRVTVLVNNELTQPGRYTVSFDASRLSSGVYVYRLIVGDKVISKRMVLIK
jgi:hypothetical protein